MFFINPFIYAGGGDFESIATVTLGTAAANMEFTSIPSTYQHLQLRLIARGTNSSAIVYTLFTLNSDTGTNYAHHGLRGNGATASAEAGSTSDAMWQNVVTGATATSSAFGAIVVDVLDYASTTKNKTIRSFGGCDSNGSGTVGIYSGHWRSTSAVTTLRVRPSSGNFAANTTAALYGVKAP